MVNGDFIRNCAVEATLPEAGSDSYEHRKIKFMNIYQKVLLDRIIQ